MGEIDAKSITGLAASYTDTVDFINAIDDRYGQVPLSEKGPLLERIGIILYQASFFNHTLTSLFYGLKYCDSTNDKAGEGRCYGGLGSVYGSLGDYHKALEYYQKSLKVAVETGDKAIEGNCFTGLGTAYLSLDDYHKACIRGYSQFEISSTLQISQPSVSRDLQFIRNQAVTRDRKEFGKRLFFEQLNTLDGVGELMKNLWRTIDDPRVRVKERMRAMKLMLECYKVRFQLIHSQSSTKEFMEYVEKVKADEQINARVDQELARRERVLQDYLDKNRIDFDKIDPMSQRKF
jgi:tetratricopeptide (TPR) repeat protein